MAEAPFHPQPDRSTWRRCLAIAVALSAGMGLCPSPAGAFDMPTDWRSAHFRDNPLVGMIKSASGTPIEPAAFAAEVAKADVVLLGETHDNADHHRLQARLVETLLAAGRKPALVFEMIPTDLQEAIDAYLATPGRSAEGFGAAVRWEERGWPDYAIYRPIVEVALGAGLLIRAGDLPRATIRSVGREGVAALPEAERTRLFLDRPMPEAERSQLSAELKASHCGMLPDAAIPPMLVAQRARDGALADALLTAAGQSSGNGAVLIAGAGHVRKDWAVPAILAGRRADAAVVSIAFVEVAEGEDEAADYGPSPEKPAPYDYILFTPRGNVSDPCEGMAEAMERMKPAK